MDIILCLNSKYDFWLGLGNKAGSKAQSTVENWTGHVGGTPTIKIIIFSSKPKILNRCQNSHSSVVSYVSNTTLRANSPQ